MIVVAVVLVVRAVVAVMESSKRVQMTVDSMKKEKDYQFQLLDLVKNAMKVDHTMMMMLDDCFV